jgi:hypothetical protein
MAIRGRHAWSLGLRPASSWQAGDDLGLMPLDAASVARDAGSIWTWEGWNGLGAIGQVAAAMATVATLIFFGYQILSSLRSARPRLEPRSSGVLDDWPGVGMVLYVSGTDPAFNIQVWVQAPRGGVLAGACQTLTPNLSGWPYSCVPSTPDENSAARWPFRDAPPPPLTGKEFHDEEWFVGLTWRDAAERQYRALWSTTKRQGRIRNVVRELPRARWRGEPPTGALWPPNAGEIKERSDVSEDSRPAKELTPEQRLEYTEINAAWRHDDTMTAALTAAIYPITFGAFVLAFSNTPARYVLAGGSVLLYCVFYAAQARLHGYSESRLGRARELEEIGGLQHHRRVNAENRALPWFRGGIRSRHVRTFMLAAVPIGWLATLLFLRTAK